MLAYALPIAVALAAALIFWSLFRMSAALDRLTAAIEANRTATEAAAAALAAKDDDTATLNMLADRLGIQTATLTKAIASPAPAPVADQSALASGNGIVVADQSAVAGSDITSAGVADQMGNASPNATLAPGQPNP